jgi:hypothetical protein
MPFDTLMQTTEVLDRLDPLRPSVRRLAQIRFGRDEFSEFLKDLEDRPQWRFSPTALFLAAKAHVFLSEPAEALAEYEMSEALWGDVLEGEDTLDPKDESRLAIGRLVLRAQIHCASKEFEDESRCLDEACGLARPHGTESYGDVLPCLNDLRTKPRASSSCAMTALV